MSLLDDSLKIRVAVSVTHYHVSHANVTPLATMWMLRNEPVSTIESYKKKEMSQNTVISMVMDIYGWVFDHMCHQIWESTHLTLIIDGSSDEHGQRPIAI